MVIEAGAKVRSYRFRCFIPTENGEKELGCSNISGLEQGIEESEIPSGKINKRGRSNPSKVNNIEVTLERGIDLDKTLWDWWSFTKKVAESYGKKLETSNKNFKRNIIVESDAREYELYHSFPIKYSVSDFDATNSNILFEEVTFKTQDIDRNFK